MAEDKSTKTEKPSAKRIRDSKKRGEVPKSQDLVVALSLLAFAFVFEPMWKIVASNLMNYITASYQHLDEINISMHSLSKIGIQAIIMMFILVGPFMILAMLMAVIGNLLQVGLIFSSTPIKPNFKKINPVSGMKNFFTVSALVNLIKTLFKFIIVIFIGYQAYKEAIPTIVNLSDVEPKSVLLFVLDFAHNIAIKVALVLLFLALMDYLYQRYNFYKNLRMTKQEVKDEFKQNEGDPQVKAKRRAQYQQMVQNSVSKVKDATVVITNPTHFAIAIKYDSEVGVPMVLAKGADEIAQKMKAKAKELDIPMIENRPIARALYKDVEPGDFIPAEMFEAVAGIIAIVYKMQTDKKGKI